MTDTAAIPIPLPDAEHYRELIKLLGAATAHGHSCTGQVHSTQVFRRCCRRVARSQDGFRCLNIGG